jgi:hypothetical protein
VKFLSDFLPPFCEMNVGLPNAEEGVPVIWQQCSVKHGYLTVLYKQ